LGEKKLRIHGRKKLQGGKISIAGSSNQVTKCIIASLLTDGDVVIKGAPLVDERRTVEGLFRYLGGKVDHLAHDVVRLNASQVDKDEIPEELCRKNRISVLCAGPLAFKVW
jgi:UDP-N-acetylglucosamine 1-carboxyvinyltransferase